MTAAGNHKRM